MEGLWVAQDGALEKQLTLYLRGVTRDKAKKGIYFEIIKQIFLIRVEKFSKGAKKICEDKARDQTKRNVHILQGVKGEKTWEREKLLR